MPTIQERDGRFQLRVKHKLLSKPYFSTFDTYDEADAYGKALKKRLDAGIIPRGLETEAPDAPDPNFVAVVRSYAKLAPITDSDSKLLDTVIKEIAGLKISAVTAGWCDDYVRELKVLSNVAPGTIRKKIGVLARVLDWHFRRTTPKGEALPVNPFRTLPRGYSLYSREDVAKLKPEEGQKARVDVKRNRRVLPGEEPRIIAAARGILAKPKLNKDGTPSKRQIMARPDLLMYYELIVDSGLRMSEAYSLRVSYLNFEKGFMHVDGSKGHRGKLKPRIVPLKPELAEKLKAYIDGIPKDELVFPFWDGTQKGKLAATRELVQQFKRLFKYAEVHDFTEHDLRHEACCRWFEMRNKNGTWKFSDVEICRIMGWSNYSMILTYASIRGEDLAAKMAA